MSTNSSGADPAGCACQGDATAVRTPVEVANRPGLSALSYRIGTYQQFKDTMLARLGSGVAGLRSRRDTDFSIALLDAFACTADTLTFYQERLANESYLSTATERRSLVELGRLIDYQPRSGVAATVHLAFTVEDAPGAPEHAASPVTIAAGLKVQSIPGPGELPRTFETVEPIVAHPEWNAMRPQLTEPQLISVDMRSLLLSGTNSGLKPGDRILIVTGPDAEQRVALEVVSATPQAGSGTTQVTLAYNPPEPRRLGRRRLPFHIFGSELIALTTLQVNANVMSFRWRQADLDAFARVQGWSHRQLMRNIRWQVAHRVFQPSAGVFSFQERAGIFGHNAPRPGANNTPPGLADSRTLLDEANTNLGRAIDLDRTYPDVIPGSWLLLKSPTTEHIVEQVEDSLELSRADFGLSGKVTRLLLSSDDSFGSLAVRETTVFAGSQQLDLAELPVLDEVEGNSIMLDTVYLGLQVGQKVIVSGERSDLAGVVDNEVMTLAEVDFSDGHTTLLFAQALSGSYVRDSVTINANVARATHGETVQETLGGGNAAIANQTFVLRQPPVTFVSSNAPTGSTSTLQVRVNDLAWQEAASFFNRAPHERVFVTQIGDDGTTTVQFGDGVNGTRPPTGTDNVRATYRKGIGRGGNLDAGKLSLLLTRPAGVRSVINPLPATGGADPENVDSIRRNAPLTIMTMDRIVSLQDYEDFARAFAGIEKALAMPWASSGRGRGVFITVAGPDGASIDPGSETYVNLLAAIRTGSAPLVPLEVQSYRKAYFEITATVMVRADYEIDAVVAAVEAALRSRFSFDARAFGQPVMLSEVMAAMQGVPGVVAVDVDQLSRIDNRLRRRELVPPAAIAAAVAEIRQDGSLVAAELLTLDPRPVHLRGVRP
jgi:baseplate J-like protein